MADRLPVGATVEFVRWSEKDDSESSTYMLTDIGSVGLDAGRHGRGGLSIYPLGVRPCPWQADELVTEEPMCPPSRGAWGNRLTQSRGSNHKAEPARAIALQK